MNHILASTLVIATTAVAAAIMPGSAYAESPTIDNTPFVSTRSRAEVRAELMREPELMKHGAIEWSMQYPLPKLQSVYTREQAKAEYKSARHEWGVMYPEDSGSVHSGKSAVRVNDGTTMGGPSR